VVTWEKKGVSLSLSILFFFVEIVIWLSGKRKELCSAAGRKTWSSQMESLF